MHQAKMDVYVLEFRNQSRMQRALDEQEIPVLLLHHVPPVDALVLPVCCWLVVDSPNVLQKLLDFTKGAEVCVFAKALAPLI